MAKFSLTTALNLYEEDQEIREELKTLDAPELGPHGENWYEHGIFLELSIDSPNKPLIEDKIALDQASSMLTRNDISEVPNLNLFVKDTTRRDRINMTKRAQMRRFEKAQIAMANSGKRQKDAMHHTSVINGEKVWVHSHSSVRADKLIKDADKLYDGKLFKETIKFLKRALELQKMGYFESAIWHIKKAIEFQTANKVKETDELFAKTIRLIEKAIDLQEAKEVEESNYLLENTILLLEKVIVLLRAKKVESAIELIEDALKFQEEEESETAIELQKTKKSFCFRKPLSLRKQKNYFVYCKTV